MVLIRPVWPRRRADPDTRADAPVLASEGASAHEEKSRAEKWSARGRRRQVFLGLSGGDRGRATDPISLFSPYPSRLT